MVRGIATCYQVLDLDRRVWLAQGRGDKIRMNVDVGLAAATPRRVVGEKKSRGSTVKIEFCISTELGGEEIVS